MIGNTFVKNLRTSNSDVTLEVFTPTKILAGIWKSCDIIKHFWDIKNYKYDRRSLAKQICALKKKKKPFDTSSTWTLWSMCYCSSTKQSQTSLSPLVPLPSPWYFLAFSLCFARQIFSYPVWHLASAICNGKGRRQLAAGLREPPTPVRESNCSSLQSTFF